MKAASRTVAAGRAERRGPWRLIAAVLPAALAGCMAVTVALAPVPLTLATATAGGDYHPVGNAICRMFNLAGEREGRPCVAVGSAGSGENIRRIQRGEAAFALAQADLAQAAYRGDGPYAAAGADPGLRVLITLHPEAFTVVARADAGIREFADLRGRRVGVGGSGAGYPFTRDAVLAAHGWTLADLGALVELAPEEQEQALCAGRVDAVFFVAGHPNGVTLAATTACRARLVRVAGAPVGRLLAGRAGYRAAVIPAGLYAGNPEDVPTVATDAVLLAASDLPDELAARIVRAVLGHFADFRRLHPVLSPLEPRDLVPAGDIPIHPGALQAYREAGLIP
jgi:TRAP transporter TAXI family solute receptor